jgi:hypothetical protein
MLVNAVLFVESAGGIGEHVPFLRAPISVAKPWKSGILLSLE